MSDIVIRAERLSKLYKIGVLKQRHDTLRDQLVHSFKSLFSGNRHHPPQPSTPPSIDGRPDIIWALKGFSFEVRQGEVVGIIGRNAAGKSTLLKILSRITEPTSGRAEIHGRVGSLLEVGTGFHPELTGRDNIYLNGAMLGMRKREINHKFDEIVAFAEIERFIDTPVKRYSSGMYLRLAFAVAAHLEPEILIVDEVLAVGDAAFQKKCLRKMGDVAKAGRTVLFVSHNLGTISRLCEVGLVMELGRIAFWGGAQEAIEFYNHQGLEAEQDGDRGTAHVVYEASDDRGHDDFEVSKIEICDTDGKPKSVVATWDDVVFRIWYSCRRDVKRGSVVLELSDPNGGVLLLLSTQPDGVLPLVFSVGDHCVECRIEKMPLAAGTY